MTKTLMIRKVDADLLHWAKTQALAREITLREYVIDAIKDAVIRGSRQHNREGDGR